MCMCVYIYISIRDVVLYVGTDSVMNYMYMHISTAQYFEGLKHSVPKVSCVQEF